MAVRYHGKMRPLPDDYPKMSADEQRAARLNAFAVQQTPQDVVLAWMLFHNWHMGKQRKRDLPSPPLHYQWIYSCAKWARNMVAAPRSFAKSTIIGKEWPLFLACTRPGTEILIVVSTDKHARRRGQWFLWQLKKNERINEDFGDLKGQPVSEQRMWTYHEIDLTNGSKLVVTSLKSVQLGSRPDVIIMDDPEPDPEKVKNWERIVSEIISLVFDVFLPMLDAGTAMIWIGTLLHRRSALYWAMTSNNKRLKFWHRILSAIVDRNSVPQWREKFPAPIIAQLKLELGDKFWAQYMNEPRSDEACTLELHASRNVYYVKTRDDAFITDPCASGAEAVYYTSKDNSATEYSDSWVETRTTLGQLARGMYRFLTVDYAEGTQDQHDFSAIHVLGEDALDCIWSLDLWAGKETLDPLCNKVFEMAYKWKAKLIAIESVGCYKALYEYALRQRAEMERKYGWIPRITQVKYPAHLSKTARIAGLEWRFKAAKVRLPDYETAAYRMLRYQVQNFTMDEAGLRNDDCVDTLAMQSVVLRPRVKNATKEGQEKARLSLAQRLVAGELFDKATGVPYASGLTQDEIPYKAIRASLLAKRNKHEKKTEPVELPIMFSLGELPGLLRNNGPGK